MTIISVLLVIGALVFYLFVRPTEQAAEHSSETGQAVTTVAPTAKRAGISVAVLKAKELAGVQRQFLLPDFLNGMQRSTEQSIEFTPTICLNWSDNHLAAARRYEVLTDSASFKPARMSLILRVCLRHFSLNLLTCRATAERTSDGNCTTR